MNFARRFLTMTVAAIATITVLSGCARSTEIYYEIGEFSCPDGEYGSVLFVYPHLITTEGMLFQDPPDIVFERLSSIRRFLTRHHGERVEDDVVYLYTPCQPYAVSYRGESAEQSGWKIYEVRMASILYFERPEGQWMRAIATIPFPIHLLNSSDLPDPWSVSAEDAVRVADFDVIADFALLVGVGTIDEDSRTITYSYPSYGGYAIVIQDQGDGTIRFIKTEEGS
ncbi:MAG TPA: hypothetical protein DCR44_01160 [Acholeplasmatales bacterium]|nr:hypothetical protein [Acholeplasmatales bacterium]